MNPYACRLVLRPRSPFEVIDLAVRYVQVDGRGLVRLALALLLPLWVAASLAQQLAGQGLLAAVLVLVASAFVQLPFTLLTALRLFDPHVRARDVLARFPQVLVPAMVRTAGHGVALLVGVFSLGMMWLPAHLALSFLGDVVLLERLSASQGVRRAMVLATERVGATLLGGLLGLGLGLWCVLAAEVTGHFLVAFVLRLGFPFGTMLDGTVTPFALAGLLLAQPAMAVYRVLLYLDVRTSLEGWDLQVALKAAAEAP